MYTTFKLILRFILYKSKSVSYIFVFLYFFYQEFYLIEISVIIPFFCAHSLGRPLKYLRIIMLFVRERRRQPLGHCLHLIISINELLLSSLGCFYRFFVVVVVPLHLSLLLTFMKFLGTATNWHGREESGWCWGEPLSIGSVRLLTGMLSSRKEVVSPKR